MAARWSEAELPLFRQERINDPQRAIKLLAAEAHDCTRCDLYKQVPADEDRARNLHFYKSLSKVPAKYRRALQSVR